jgi:hypothetical protein
MERLHGWIQDQVRRVGPGLATLALLALSMLLAACGKGGGTGY